MQNRSDLASKIKQYLIRYGIDDHYRVRAIEGGVYIRESTALNQAETLNPQAFNYVVSKFKEMINKEFAGNYFAYYSGEATCYSDRPSTVVRAAWNIYPAPTDKRVIELAEPLLEKDCKKLYEFIKAARKSMPQSINMDSTQLGNTFADPITAQNPKFPVTFPKDKDHIDLCTVLKIFPERDGRIKSPLSQTLCRLTELSPRYEVLSALSQRALPVKLDEHIQTLKKHSQACVVPNQKQAIDTLIGFASDAKNIKDTPLNQQAEDANKVHNELLLNCLIATNRYLNHEISKEDLLQLLQKEQLNNSSKANDRLFSMIIHITNANVSSLEQKPTPASNSGWFGFFESVTSAVSQYFQKPQQTQQLQQLQLVCSTPTASPVETQYGNFGFHQAKNRYSTDALSSAMLPSSDLVNLNAVAIGERLATSYQEIDQKHIDDVDFRRYPSAGGSTTVFDGKGNLVTATLGSDVAFAAVYGTDGSVLRVTRLNTMAQRPKPYEPNSKPDQLDLLITIGNHAFKKEGTYAKAHIDINTIDSLTSNINKSALGKIQIIALSNDFIDRLINKSYRTKEDHEVYLTNCLKEINKADMVESLLAQNMAEKIKIDFPQYLHWPVSIAIQTIEPQKPLLVGVYSGYCAPRPYSTDLPLAAGISRKFSEKITPVFQAQCRLTKAQYEEQERSKKQTSAPTPQPRR